MSDTSKTEGLDRTIASLNEMLENEKLTLKERLQISDRLLRAYGLKYKHTSDGKGGKFSELDTSTGSTE